MAIATPAVIWFTGLPSSGKTTLAISLEQQLNAAGWPILRLDGDELRRGINSDLGFSVADRRENVRRTAEIARLACASGVTCLVALVSPFQSDRDLAKSIVGASRYFEIYLNTPLAVCEGRDVKGLYKRARNGEIPNFTGISDPYEPPKSPNLVIDTGSMTIKSATAKIVSTLRAPANA